MSNESGIRFSGFEPKAVEFLGELKENNNKPWFEDHRQIYNSFVLKPLQHIVTELTPLFMSIDPLIETAPSIGKTISRMNRDTRFSNDKSPYKSHVWITFKRPIKEWQDSPGFFFELTPYSYRYGMGFYSADKTTMDQLREAIDNHPAEFKRIASLYRNQQTFVIEGEKYKRPIGNGQSAEILDWYQRKNVYLVCNRGIDERLFTSQLLVDLATGFGQLAELYHYFQNIKIKKRSK